MVPPDSGRIPPVPPYSGSPAPKIVFSPTGLSPPTVVLSSTVLLRPFYDLRVLQPRFRRNGTGLGSSAFARHYSRNHYCVLFLCLLRCFSSAGSPPLRDVWPSARRVAPFGNPGINIYLQLRPAYRSLSRPSSPPGALASPVRPWLLSCIPFTTSRFLARALFFLVARIQPVSQLNVSRVFFFHYVNELSAFRLVENKGVEPLTPSLQS